VRRRALIALAALALAAAACGGGGDDGGDSTSPTAVPQPTVIDRDNPITPELEAYLARVDPDLAFTATYTVLQRAGGTTSTVTVDADGTITAKDGELVVERPADTADEAKLNELGIFSTFYAEGPAAQIEATARRADADDPIFATRTVAGVELDCVQVPVLGATASQWCLTPEGIFGFVSTPAVQYELTAYAVA